MASGTNYVANPSFETNTTGWTVTGGTLSRVAVADPGSGQYSAKVVATGGAPIVLSATVTGLTVGKRYVLSAYPRVDPVGDSFTPILNVDADFSSAAPITPGRFVRKFVGFLAGATSVTITITSDRNNLAGDILYLDKVALVEGAKLGPYFDGSYPLCSWTGTTHGSSSVCSFIDALGDVDAITTPEIVVANGMCLNLYSATGSTKAGRYSVAQVRGDNITSPSARGQTFQSNRPIDSGVWTMSMILLGANPDGTVPWGSEQRTIFERNLRNLRSTLISTSKAIDLYAWQPDGVVLHSKASMIGQNASFDATVMMGGRRAEITLGFDILAGVWEDAVASVITGTPGAGWSDQSLTLTGLAGGEVDIEDAVVTVQGPITNPKVMDPTTGVWVQYTGTVSAGQSWIIDSANWTSMIDAVSVLADTTHGGYPKFVLISHGDAFTVPTLALSGTGTGSTTNLSVTASRCHWSA